MYFNDRISLGTRLAQDLTELKGTDAILVCLKPSSLMVAVSMAVQLRAWVFPLFYENIINPLDPTSKLGAMTQTGELCLNPSLTESDSEYY